jgi:hypothetical protein
MRRPYYTLNPADDRYIAHLDARAALEAANALGQDRVAYNRDILLYYLAQDFRFVSGHFAFNNIAYKKYGDKYDFVTLLRDPVKKWISVYFYTRTQEGKSVADKNILEAFLDTETAVGYGSDYAMKFAGDDTISDFTSQEAVDRAISNLNHFDLVGVLEQLPLFISDFRALYGVQLDVPVMRRNPVSADMRKEQITPEIEARIAELCRPNMAIYQYAVDNLIGSYVPQSSP